MKRLLSLLFGAVLMIGLIGVASAEAQTKIGIVDIDIVMEQSEAGRIALEQMNQIIGARQADLDSLLAQITALETELQESEELEDAERAVLEGRIDQLVSEYINRMNSYQAEIDEIGTILQQNLLADIEAVLQFYGDQNGYEMILDASAVLYYRRVVDLTYEIIRTYDDFRRQGAIQPVPTE